MFGTTAISEPWHLDVRRPTIHGPRVTRFDVAVLGAVGLILLAIAAPALAVGLAVLGVLGVAAWQGATAVGPMTRPIVDGERPLVLDALGPYGFSR